MQKLILILLAFLALFTFIRAFDVQAAVGGAVLSTSLSTPTEGRQTAEAADGNFAGSPEKAGISIEKSVEIAQ